MANDKKLVEAITSMDVGRILLIMFSGHPGKHDQQYSAYTGISHSGIPMW